MVKEGGGDDSRHKGGVGEGSVDELASRRREIELRDSSHPIHLDAAKMSRASLEADISSLPPDELISLQETLNLQLELAKKLEFEGMSPMERMNKLREIEGEIFGITARLNDLRFDNQNDDLGSDDRQVLSSAIVRLSALAVDHKVLLIVLKENGQV